MDKNNQEDRLVRLWIIMIAVAIAVIVGWVFLLRHNFAKINAEMNARGETMEQAAQEMDATFKKMEEVIQSIKAKTEKSADKPTAAVGGAEEKTQGVLAEEGKSIPSQTEEIKK